MVRRREKRYEEMKYENENIFLIFKKFFILVKRVVFFLLGRLLICVDKVSLDIFCMVY